MKELTPDRQIAYCVMENDRASALHQIARKLAHRLDAATETRAVTSLAKQLRETLAELATLGKEQEQAKQPEKVSPLYVIQSKQAARLSATKDSKRTKAS
jgi:hypothetical protein